MNMPIGVVATIPNFADRLQREGKRVVYCILYCAIRILMRTIYSIPALVYIGVTVEDITAGKYKRTMVCSFFPLIIYTLAIHFSLPIYAYLHSLLAIPNLHLFFSLLPTPYHPPVIPLPLTPDAI